MNRTQLTRFTRLSSTSRRALTLALLTTVPAGAHADVRYTTVTSMRLERDGAMQPVSTVTTSLKDGLSRAETRQNLSFYQSAETVILSRARRERTTFDPNLKLYTVEPLRKSTVGQAGTGAPGSANDGTSKAGIGKIVLTLAAKFLGIETVAGRKARHYSTSMTMDSSGCCGTGKTQVKTEVWMADVTLPVVDLQSSDWKSTFRRGDGRTDCRVTLETRGDVKAYEAAQKGLALKTVMFDSKTGKPFMTSQITMLSFAALPDSAFAVPTGFKKVDRAAYDQARTLAMASASGPADRARREETPNRTTAVPATPVETTPAKSPAVEESPATPVVATPRVVNPAQTAALLTAMKKDDWNAVRAAVEAGADLNATDKNGATALMRASAARQPELVQLLLSQGANTNLLDKKGRSALHYAVPEVAKAKKKRGLGGLLGSVGGSLVGGALSGGMGDLFSKNPLAASLLSGTPLDGLMKGHLQSLLSAQSFDVSGKSGWTAIAGAALQGDLEGKAGIASLLGGPASKLNAEQWTGLLSSVKGSKPEILGAMAQLGGGKTAQSAAWNEFLQAASSGDQATVSALMVRPELAPLLAQATNGLNAAKSDLPGNASRSIISALVAGGANAGAVNRDGKTPAQVAQERGFADIASLLNVK